MLGEGLHTQKDLVWSLRCLRKLAFAWPIREYKGGQEAEEDAHQAEGEEGEGQVRLCLRTDAALHSSNCWTVRSKKNVS